MNLQNDDGVREKLRELESRTLELEKSYLLTDNNALFAKEKFTELSARVNNIQAGINRLIWTGGGLIIVAVGNFILKGGLLTNAIIGG